MEILKYLNKTITVKIDRPIGTKYKNYESIYPINYGYVPNTISGDGEELDCFILGVYEPIETFEGKCIAIIHRLNDNDDKLVIAPEGKNYTNEEIRALTYFQEQYFISELIRPEGYLEFSKNIPELSVSNLEKSIEFYKTAGFKIEYERPENKFVFISLGKIQFMLQEITGPNKWDLAPLSHPYGNGINFEFDLDSISEVYEKVKESEYKITFDLEQNTYQCGEKKVTNREFLIQDPDGYLLRFAEEK